MKLLNDINWKSGGNFDRAIEWMQKKEKTNIYEILLINSFNYSRHVQGTWEYAKEINDSFLFYFEYKGNKKHDFGKLQAFKKSKFKTMEKLKLLLIFFDFLCDSRRFNLEESCDQINSARLTLQKFCYSLEFDVQERHEFSNLWYLSLCKTLIDTLSISNKQTIGSKVEECFGKSIKKQWQEWSNQIKEVFDVKNNKYIDFEKNEIDSGQLRNDIINVFSEIPIKVIKNILNKYFNDDQKNKLNKFIEWINTIEKSDISELKAKGTQYTPRIKKYNPKTNTKEGLIKEIIKDEMQKYQIYTKETKYLNPVFFRGFNKIIKKMNDKHKKILANYSHRDLYKNIDILVQKQDYFFVKKGDGKFSETYDKILEYIEEYINEK